MQAVASVTNGIKPPYPSHATTRGAGVFWGGGADTANASGAGMAFLWGGDKCPLIVLKTLAFS